MISLEEETVYKMQTLYYLSVLGLKNKKNDKEMSSTEYLGCNIETFKKHIEQQFTEAMPWENYGEWHIDHKIQLKYNKPSLKGVAQRLQNTNTQPMWASKNMSKGC